jgi:type III secretory pathway component EscT
MEMDISWSSPLGIATVLVATGIFWACFAAGVYLFTLSGKTGTEIENSSTRNKE